VGREGLEARSGVEEQNILGGGVSKEVILENKIIIF
jgi:hypothetical protein